MGNGAIGTEREKQDRSYQDPEYPTAQCLSHRHPSEGGMVGNAQRNWLFPDEQCGQRQPGQSHGAQSQIGCTPPIYFDNVLRE